VSVHLGCPEDCLAQFCSRERKATAVLIGAQVLVILLDIPAVVLAWPWPSMGAMIIILGTLYPTLYAIKLKIELVVLNQLVQIVRHGIGNNIPATYTAEYRNHSTGNTNGWMAPPGIRKLLLFRRAKSSAYQDGQP
jgi:hypothetical protein